MRPLLLLLLITSLNAPANAEDIKIPLGKAWSTSRSPAAGTRKSMCLIISVWPMRNTRLLDSHRSLAGITATFPSISRVTG